MGGASANCRVQAKEAGASGLARDRRRGRDVALGELDCHMLRVQWTIKKKPHVVTSDLVRRSRDSSCFEERR